MILQEEEYYWIRFPKQEQEVVGCYTTNFSGLPCWEVCGSDENIYDTPEVISHIERPKK